MENRAFAASAATPDCPATTLATPDLEEQITLLSASITVATWRLLMLGGARRALLRALAQLEMRHRHGCGAREGTRGAGAGIAASG